MREAYIGIHSWDIPQHDPTAGWVWDFVAQTVYYPTLSLIKASLLIFLLRLGGTKQVVGVACELLIAFEITKGGTAFLACLFQCWPLDMAWKPGATQGQCIRMDIFSVTMACLDIATTIAVLALPYMIFLGLKINMKIRLAIISLFMLGIL